MLGRPCAGCEARTEEIAHLREELAATRSDASKIREAAEAERRDLSLKLVALADTRAALSVRDPGAAPRERPKPRPEDLRFPASINSIIGGGHADLDGIRRRLTQPDPKGDVPPVVTS